VILLDQLRSLQGNLRTAVYGTVRTVVWEGGSREAPPYPIPTPSAPDGHRGLTPFSPTVALSACSASRRSRGIALDSTGSNFQIFSTLEST